MYNVASHIQFLNLVPRSLQSADENNHTTTRIRELKQLRKQREAENQRNIKPESQGARLKPKNQKTRETGSQRTTEPESHENRERTRKPQEPENYKNRESQRTTKPEREAQEPENHRRNTRTHNCAYRECRMIKK